MNNEMGELGGMYVPEMMVKTLKDIDKGFEEIIKKKEFNEELKYLLKEFVGRPSPLYRANNLSKEIGCKVYLKREDLIHSGAHKINNTLVQAILAKKLCFKEIIKILIENGASSLELGFAFTDPIADGPAVQAANNRALKSEITTKKSFEILEYIRSFSEIPISIMMNYNIAYKFGLDDFYKKCSKIKIDGILFPDVPLEKNETITEMSKKYNIHQIYLVATNSSKDRIKEITSVASGYIYLVSILGTTGSRSEIEKIFKTKISEIKEFSNLPIYVFFGISEPKHVKEVFEMGASGAISGSAICKIIEKNEDDLIKKIEEFTKKKMSEATS